MGKLLIVINGTQGNAEPGHVGWCVLNRAHTHMLRRTYVHGEDNWIPIVGHDVALHGPPVSLADPADADRIAETVDGHVAQLLRKETWRARKA